MLVESLVNPDRGVLDGLGNGGWHGVPKIANGILSTAGHGTQHSSRNRPANHGLGSHYIIRVADLGGTARPPVGTPPCSVAVPSPHSCSLLHGLVSRSVYETLGSPAPLQLTPTSLESRRPRSSSRHPR